MYYGPLLPEFKDYLRTAAQWYAEGLIDPDFAALSPFHIPEDLLATAEYVEDLGEKESLFQDIWTAFHLS